MFCRKYYPTVGNSTVVSFFSCASVTTHLASPELVDLKARDTAPDLSKCSETGRAKSLLTSQAYEKLRLYRWSLPGVWGFAAYITATNYLQAQKIVRPQVVTSAIVLALHAPINLLLIYTFGKPVATSSEAPEAEHDLCLSILRCVSTAALCCINAAFHLLLRTISFTTDYVLHSSMPVTVDACMHNPEGVQVCLLHRMPEHNCFLVWKARYKLTVEAIALHDMNHLEWPAGHSCNLSSVCTQQPLCSSRL